MEEALFRNVEKKDANSATKLIDLAKNGNKQAQEYVGNMYRFGLMVNVDLKTAKDWYLKADTDKAKVEIGRMYLTGEGEKQDPEKALEWFQKAGKEGYNEIGHMYQTGNGVQKDYYKALTYFEKGKDIHSYNNIGYAHLNGYGVPQDYNKALEYYLKSNNLSENILSCNQLGYLYQNGFGVTKDIDKALEYFNKAVSIAQKSVYSPKCLTSLDNNIGIIHEQKKNYKEAMIYFKKAADLGDKMACYNIGSLYLNGYGVPQDYKEAMKYYVLADIATSYNQIGFMYKYGLGVNVDNLQAVRWYNKAANCCNSVYIFNEMAKVASIKDAKQTTAEFLNWCKLNDSDSEVQYFLGYINFFGIEVSRNYSNALTHFSQVKNNDKHAHYYIGNIHEEGLSVTKDLKTAFESYLKSAELGNQVSFNRLKSILLTNNSIMDIFVNNYFTLVADINRLTNNV